ncbi:MAG: pantoate--beta-alanine ligase [Deltaproteobacteria bacterium]|nr:pantoate--beta-alanine ligase [Deltaproteobacteria bacterium]
MDVIRSVDTMHALALGWRARGKKVGFVPTMGYLHRGHTTLIELMRQRCEILVVSIYVNPLQFAPNEDLGRYPRDPEGDARKCEAAKCDILFMPDNLYPPDFRTTVNVGQITTRWEGAARPTHFQGVATVVCRLFGLVQPTAAMFGEKDYQQFAVLKSMAHDLAMGIEIVPGPLVRDHDGLALSSRNVYLSAEDRRRALSLHRALYAMRDSRAPTATERVAEGRAILDCDSLDYLAVVDPDTLEPVERIDRPLRAIATARYGKTRLLDNVAIEP